MQAENLSIDTTVASSIRPGQVIPMDDFSWNLTDGAALLFARSCPLMQHASLCLVLIAMYTSALAARPLFKGCAYFLSSWLVSSTQRGWCPVFLYGCNRVTTACMGLVGAKSAARKRGEWPLPGPSFGCSFSWNCASALVLRGVWRAGSARHMRNVTVQCSTVEDFYAELAVLEPASESSRLWSWLTLGFIGGASPSPAVLRMLCLGARELPRRHACSTLRIAGVACCSMAMTPTLPC